MSKQFQDEFFPAEEEKTATVINTPYVDNNGAVRGNVEVMTTTKPVAIATKSTVSLIEKIASRFNVDSNKFVHTLKTTVFKGAKGQEITNEQFMALMVLVDQYQLNPFTKEIYAYPDKSGGVVPVLGVDGWLRLMNSHPAMNGVTYNYSENNIQLTGMKSECYEWVECVIYRKDRVNPIVVREYLDEAYRPQGNSPVPGPWQIYTRRMLRHRATIQAIRTAFSYSGLYDEDTAQDILNSQEIDGGIVREVVKNPMVKPGVVLGNRLDKFIEDMLQRLPQVGYQQAITMQPLVHLTRKN